MPGSTRPSLQQRLRQLRTRTPRRLLQTAASIAEDRLYERRHGLDVLATRSPSEILDAVGQSGDLGRAYHPTRRRHLRALFRSLQLPPGLGIADLGSGKGLVLLTASEYAFGRIVGVEHSPELCAIARDNLRRMGLEEGPGRRVEVVCADAAVWQPGPEINVLYLFNPFEPSVLAAAVDGFRRSLLRHPRPSWLVLNKTVLPGQSDVQEGFRHERDLHYGSSRMQVYRGSLPR